MMTLPRSATVVLDDVSERIAVLFALYDSSDTSDDQILDYLINMIHHFHHIAAAAISGNRLSEAFAVLRKCDDAFTEKTTERKVLAVRCAASPADQDVVDALKQRTYVLLSRLEAKRNREAASLQPHPVYYKKHLPPVPGSRVAQSVAAIVEGRHYQRPNSAHQEETAPVLRHVMIQPQQQNDAPVASPLNPSQQLAGKDNAEDEEEEDEASPSEGGIIMVCPMPPSRITRPLQPLNAKAASTLPPVGVRKDHPAGGGTASAVEGNGGDSHTWRKRGEDHLLRAAKVVRSAKNSVNGMLTEAEQQQARVQVQRQGRTRLRDTVEEDMANAVGADALTANVMHKARGSPGTVAVRMVASAATAAIAPVRPVTLSTTATGRSGRRIPAGGMTPSRAAAHRARSRSPLTSSAPTRAGGGGGFKPPASTNYSVLFEEPDHPLFKMFAIERMKALEAGGGNNSNAAINAATTLSGGSDPLLNFSDQKQLVMQRLQMLNMIPTKHLLSVALHEEMKKKVEGGVRYKPAVPLDRTEMENFVSPVTVDRIVGPRETSPGRGSGSHGSSFETVRLWSNLPAWPAVSVEGVFAHREAPVIPSLQYLQLKKHDWTILSEDYMGTCLELCVACRRIQYATRMFLAKITVAKRTAAVKAVYESTRVQMEALIIVIRVLRAAVARRRVREQQKHVQYLIDQRVELELKGGMLGGLGGKDRCRSRVGTLFATSTSSAGMDSCSIIESLFGSSVLLGHSKPNRRRASSISDELLKKTLYVIPRELSRRYHEQLRGIYKKIAARKIRRFYVERTVEIVRTLFIEALGYADHLSGTTAFPYSPIDFTDASRQSSTTSVSEAGGREGGEGLVFTFQSPQTIIAKYSGEDVTGSLLNSIKSAQGLYAPLVHVKLSDIAANKARRARELELIHNQDEERQRKAQEVELMLIERRRSASVVLQRLGRGYRVRMWLQHVYIQVKQSSHKIKMWGSTSSRSLTRTNSRLSDTPFSSIRDIPVGVGGGTQLVGLTTQVNQPEDEDACITPGAEMEIMRLIKLHSSHLLPEFREEKMRERLQATILVQSLLRSHFSTAYKEWRLVQRAARTIQVQWRQYMSYKQQVHEAKASIRSSLMRSGAWDVDDVGAGGTGIHRTGCPGSSSEGSAMSQEFKSPSWMT